MSSWSELTFPELTAPELALSEFASLALTSPKLTSPKLTSPKLTSPKLTSPKLTSPKLTWSTLSFPKLPSYEFAYPEFNPMSSSLAEPALPKFASPKDVYPRRTYKSYLEQWKAAIWGRIPYIMIPRLPPELMDYIIDFVGGKPDFSFPDRQTLYSCALVCRAWFPASRYRLYGSRQTVQSSKHFEALVRASRIPHMACSLRSVRKLHLEDSKPAWVHQLPFVLGQVFSAVQELHIQYIRWDAVVMHRHVLLIGFTQFGCITKLTLSDCTFRNFCQFRHLICALPRLQMLEVKNLSMKTSKAFPITIATSRFSALTRLSLSCDLGHKQSLSLHSALLEWLVLMPASIRSLQSLAVNNLSRRTSAPLTNLLQHVGTSLESLCLALYALTASDVQNLNVSRFTGLRNLNLRWVHGMSLAEILHIISPNCRLHELRIGMYLGGVEREWESAARILDEQQFISLRKFELAIQDKTLTGEEKQCISGSLDALRRRGVRVIVELTMPQRCLWGECDVWLDDISAGGIQRHIQAIHSNGHWIREHPGECRWNTEQGLCGCRMMQGSYGKHVASTHLQSTPATCDKCRRTFARLDALRRHMDHCRGVTGGL